MSLFNESACPQCGNALPLKALWEFARTEDVHVLPGLKLLGRSGLFMGRIGVECPHCSAKLLLIQTRLRLLLLVLWGSLLAAFGLFGSVARAHGLVLSQVFVAAASLAGIYLTLLLQRRLMPYFADVRLITDSSGVSFPLNSAYESTPVRGPVDGSDI
jgi:hypothetical protein